MYPLRRTLLSLSIAAVCGPAFADDAAELDRVVVVGTKERAAAQPGSAQVLDQAELESARVLSVAEALRKVPGVVVRDEGRWRFPRPLRSCWHRRSRSPLRGRGGGPREAWWRGPMRPPWKGSGTGMPWPVQFQLRPSKSASVFPAFCCSIAHSNSG